MWIRNMLRPDSISTARFLFELLGGRVFLLLVVAWLMVEAADVPAVAAAGSEQALHAVVRKGKRG